MHSWAGIGLGLEDAKKLGGKFLGQPKFERVRQRWQSVQTLIIDEGLRYTTFKLSHEKANCIITVSMIDGKLFDKLVWRYRSL